MNDSERSLTSFEPYPDVHRGASFASAYAGLSTDQERLARDTLIDIESEEGDGPEAW